MEKFCFPRAVRGYEIDASGLLQSGNYFRYMEECECAFFKDMGLSFFKKGSEVVFPRVSTHCKVHLPIKNEDELFITPYLEKISRSSITFLFEFFKQDKEGNRYLVAQGGFSIVACIYNEDEKKLMSTPMGDDMRNKLLAYKDMYDTSAEPITS